MFDPNMTIERLNAMSQDTMIGHLGIEFIEIGSDFVKARMPVDDRTRQPFGLLHGGASATLIETLGSVASVCCLDTKLNLPVGLEINANHIRPIKSGYVVGTASPLHVGRRTHVWEIRIVDEEGRLVSAGRLTLMIIDA